MKDAYKREIDYLRISLTDRCQLKCQYCVPETGIKPMPNHELLTKEEMKEIVKTFAQLGVKKLKLTGGEPLLRSDFISIVSELKAIEGIEEITLTTNGIGLSFVIDDLVEAGLDGVTISLDTLDPQRYRLLTGRNQLESVLLGLERALQSKIKKIKVNCVVIKELNQDEILKIARLAQDQRLHVRFIEWMPIGANQKFTSVSELDILNLLKESYGFVNSFKEKLGNGPARYFEIKGFQGKIGFISALSHDFCATCNRVRLTCDGFLKPCLYYDQGVNLKEALSKKDLESQIVSALKLKPKSHDFINQSEDGRELKSMVQIGG